MGVNGVDSLMRRSSSGLHPAYKNTWRFVVVSRAEPPSAAYTMSSIVLDILATSIKNDMPSRRPTRSSSSCTVRPVAHVRHLTRGVAAWPQQPMHTSVITLPKVHCALFSVFIFFNPVFYFLFYFFDCIFIIWMKRII